MSVTRQWDILNKPELERIAVELCHYQGLRAASGKFLLADVVTAFRAEVTDEINKAAQSANQGLFSRYIWGSTASKNAFPVLNAIDVLANGFAQLESIERLKALVTFLDSQQAYSDRLIAALIKKHPNCPSRLANQVLPEEVTARVKESFNIEAKKLIEINKTIPKPPPAPNKEQIDWLSKRKTDTFFKVAESSVIDELRMKFVQKDKKAADELKKAEAYEAEIERLSRITL